MSSALVGIDDACERRLAHAGVVIHHVTVLELDPKIIDLVAVVDERHGRVHDTVSAHAIGRGEDLLGGDVGEEGMTVGGLALTAGPLMALRHTNRQIGSVRSGVVQAVKLIIV